MVAIGVGLVVLLVLVAVALRPAEDGESEPVRDRPMSEPPFFATEDLDGIRESGKLRILFPRRDVPPHLPRAGYPLDFERELAERFAESQELEPVWVFVDSRDELLDALDAGRGDIVAANLTSTRKRRERVAFTVPIAVVKEQIVARAGEPPIGALEDLVGRRIHIRRSSSFWQTLEPLVAARPGIERVAIGENSDTEDAIDRVGRGEYDLTVADSNVIDSVLAYRNDVEPAFDLTGDRPIAWAVRKGSPRLLDALDRFLTDQILARRDDERRFDDWPVIKERKVIRMLTRNNVASYFLWRGRLVGFEYDLMKEFARREGLLLEVVVVPTQGDLYQWLLDGKGDVIAASQSPTPERRGMGVEFSRPYNRVSHVVIAPIDFPEMEGPEELAGSTFYIRPSSSYRRTLDQLIASGIELTIEPAPPELETEEIIARVAGGEVGLTVADSHIAGIELAHRRDIKILMELRDAVPIGWGVRKDNPELLAAIDGYLGDIYRGLFFNVTYKKYFRDSKRIKRLVAGRSEQSGRLSPYDDIVRKYAEDYGFDWRLIVAQMYEESRFDPDAVSFAGARGLMQVLPSTATEFGFEDLDEPETMIHAGVKYLDWVRDRFEPDLSVTDRTWFALAGYNAGTGHVREARRLARERGLNPNVWFGNVEKTMLLLQRDEYANQSRYGYCRCTEPVRYVRNISRRFSAYLSTMNQASVAPEPRRASG